VAEGRSGEEEPDGDVLGVGDDGLRLVHDGLGRCLELQVAGRVGNPAVGGALAGLYPKTTQKQETRTMT
jgi:hypothetical protein